jgi:hypothetical protein
MAPIHTCFHEHNRFGQSYPYPHPLYFGLLGAAPKVTSTSFGTNFGPKNFPKKAKIKKVWVVKGTLPK